MLHFEQTESIHSPDYTASCGATRVTTPGTDMGGLMAHCLAQTLDHVGRGLLLLGPASQLLLANRLAQSALAMPGHALLADGGRVTARSARDQKQLTDAIEAALHKGKRRLLTLGCHEAEGAAAGPLTVAILPIEVHADSEPGLPRAQAVLISLPQSSRHKNQAVDMFARAHGCTGAEAEVLEALLAGQTPEAIALKREVKLCTVRTQIGQLRLKTGSHTIRELLDRVAALPPMMVMVQ